ncbi:iron-containing alcohol dehydrogenase [Roseitranquillus sediminis]|uniref:iron-containing alcohol dehydrogenase n=1 Tax=Roseitranquillus sediminis TaxID=2809051 RepID=UPI003872BBA1
MAPFTFATVDRLRFGRGVAAEASDVVARRGERVLLVHGRSTARAAWLVEALDARGLLAQTYACTAEPDLDMLLAALDVAREARADCVVALGGGAAVDLGKAVAALAPAAGAPLDHLEVVGAGRPLEAEPLPFVALPTTAGTGAEMTRNAVIGVPEHRRKVSLRDERMLADVALVDPALTDGCPRAVTLASGLDALVQVIEPYCSTRANPLTDAICRPAIPMALDALPRLMEDEDAEARDRMAWVSVAGGIALANSGLGVIHGLAGPIGGMTSASHGAICGALLPHGLRANLRALGRTGRLDEVERLIAGRFGGIDGLERWMHDSGLPRLSALGVRAADHVALAEAALGSSSMRANPAPLNQRAVAAILADAG